MYTSTISHACISLRVVLIVKLKQPHDETIEKASHAGSTLYDEFYLLSP